MSNEDRRKRVVMVGDPVQGFQVIGPFDTAEDAISYACIAVAAEGVTWWVTTINAPDWDA